PNGRRVHQRHEAPGAERWRQQGTATGGQDIVRRLRHHQAPVDRHGHGLPRPGAVLQQPRRVRGGQPVAPPRAHRRLRRLLRAALLHRQPGRPRWPALLRRGHATGLLPVQFRRHGRREEAQVRGPTPDEGQAAGLRTRARLGGAVYLSSSRSATPAYRATCSRTLGRTLGRCS
ncbi:hypothetical protein BAE44_0020831, partial [Dichanthelium oligosanthes]